MKKDEIAVSYIMLYTAYGENISTMYKKACTLALHNQAEVRFVHNGREFSVTPEAILDAVERCN